MTTSNESRRSESDVLTNNQQTQSKDNVFDVLSNSRRRRVVWCLALSPNWSMTKREIAAHIAAAEAEAIATREVDYGDVTEIIHKLQDYHLDPLEDINAINVEQDRITATSRIVDIMPVLVHGRIFAGPD